MLELSGDKRILIILVIQNLETLLKILREAVMLRVKKLKMLQEFLKVIQKVI